LEKLEYHPKVSIVIPVYNTEKYLCQCIDSVIHQTYRNLDIILVDDGSVDDSSRICDEYARQDGRVRVIHQDNHGSAEARNRGITAASGEYIMFIDSDDWVDVEMCESMIDALKHFEVQSVMCAYVREYPNTSLPKILHSENTVWTGRDFQRRICGPIQGELRNPENLDCYSMMCGKLYPLEAVKGISVKDLRLIGSSEDTLYNFEAYFNIDRMVYLNTPFYHYRKLFSASVSGSYKPRLESQWDNLYAAMAELIDYNHLDNSFVVALNNRIALNLIGLGLNSVHGKDNFHKKQKRIKGILTHSKRIEALKQLALKDMPIHWKLFFGFAKHKCSFLVYILLVAISKLKGKV